MPDLPDPTAELYPLQALLGQAGSMLSSGGALQTLCLVKEGLKRHPDSAELHHLAGACAAALGDLSQAERYWRQTLALCPHAAEAHFNLGLLYTQCGRPLEAELSYRMALASNPGNLQAFAQLGALLAAMHRDTEAEHCYRKLLALNPGDAATLSDLGVFLAGRRQDKDAERCYRLAIALDPANAKALSNLGVLLARGGRGEEAEACYRRSLQYDSSAAETHTNLGLLLEDQARFDEAERCHRHALMLRPGQAAVHANLGNLLTRLRREAEAEARYYRSIAFDPGSAVAYSALGVLLTNLERDSEAEIAFHRAITINPDYALARLNLGFLLLRQGRYREGWPYHEARYHPNLPDQPKFRYPVTVSLPQWRGESLEGKSLLVWTEQGYGDEIQFSRYLPLLKRQGAAHITLACKPPLKTLMETLTGVDEVVDVTHAACIATGQDYWTYPLSIPLHCRTTLENIPAELPYLQAPPAQLAHWAGRLPTDGFRVGLVWKGNRSHGNDIHRSLPDLATLAPLWEVPGVIFISLQKGQGAEEARNSPPNRPLLHLGDDIIDFADAAAVVTHLDLVISVDTAVAHLAGALRKRCWVFLPAYRCDWRWLRDRDDSPWYPDVMRLFRQADDQDWTQAVLQVKDALAAMVSDYTALS